RTQHVIQQPCCVRLDVPLAHFVRLCLWLRTAQLELRWEIHFGNLVIDFVEASRRAFTLAYVVSESELPDRVPRTAGRNQFHAVFETKAQHPDRIGCDRLSTRSDALGKRVALTFVERLRSFERPTRHIQALDSLRLVALF